MQTSGATSIPAAAADFAASFGGVADAAFGQTASTFDAADNVYIVGSFGDVSLTIGTVTITKIGSSDTVVIKIDAAGAVVWAKNFGGSGVAVGQSIAVDSSGNVYVGGYFLGPNLTSPALTIIGNQDAFAFKLDSTGSIVWARNFGGRNAIAHGLRIAVDESGSVYLGGYFLSANLTTPALTKIGSSDAFAFKLDSVGNSVWSRNFGGNGAHAYGHSIATDASGNVYLGGNFEDGNLTTPALNRIGSRDAFGLKLDSAGSSVWSRNFGGNGASTSVGNIAVDASGNVYLCGSFEGTNLSTPALTKIGSSDAFVFKLDNVGSSVWSKNFGGSGASVAGRSIAIDASSNVYLGGNFDGGNLTTPTLTKVGFRDAFAFKFDIAGTAVWTKNFGGSAANAGGQSIAVDTFGNVYLGGVFDSDNLTTPALTRIGNRNTFALTLDNAGNTSLAKGISYLAPGGDIILTATAVDTTGNTYISGYFTSAIATLGSITLTRIGSTDVFVAKLNAAGTVLWAKNFGGGGAIAYGESIAVDVSGNVYLSGYFHNANLTTPALTKIGDFDAFAFKLDNVGISVWSKNFGGSGAYAFGQSIAVDASSNVYLGGYFYNANLTTPALTTIGFGDAFAFKLDSAGTSVWARKFGGSGAYAEGRGIAVDASGNVYLGGYFESANLTSPALTKIGDLDAFAFKLDSAGTSVWARNFGGSGANAGGNSIAVDASGNVYLGGNFRSANLTTPGLTKIGSSDAFAFKLNNAGTTVWAKNFGGSGAIAVGRSIAVDASGNVYLGGNLEGNNLTTPALNKIGTSDAFAFKLDSFGTSVRSRNFGGSGATVRVPGIAVDASGNVYLAGYFRNANLTTPAFTKIGNQDAFIIKQFAANAFPLVPILMLLLL